MQFDLISSLLLVGRIMAFGIPFAATLFTLLPAENRWALLAEDANGRRMVIFSVILAAAAAFTSNGVALTTIAATVAFWFAFGLLIAVKDTITYRLLPGWAAAIYLPLGLAAYFFGAGYGSFGFSGSANVYGFTQMLLPVGVVTLFLNLTLFSGLLTDGFKARITPQDNAGLRFMFVAVILVLAAIYNTNGIAMIAIMVFAMNAFAYGFLVWLPNKYTNFLVHDYVAIPFSILTAATFYTWMM